MVHKLSYAYKRKEVDMKQKIVKAFFVATFFTIGVVTGCSDAGNIKMGTEAETAKDADAASETSSVGSAGAASATSVDSDTAINAMTEPEGGEADMETWKTAIDGLFLWNGCIVATRRRKERREIL